MPERYLLPRPLGPLALPMDSTSLHTIVSFDSVSDAFAFSRAAADAEIPGRLRTIPRQISAGCGTAWDSPAGWHDRIEQLVFEQQLEIDAIYQL